MQLSVVVPIYNEQGVLLPMAEGLAHWLDRFVGADQWRMILVDNGSVDDTPREIEQICARWPATLPINLTTPNIGMAFRVGLQHVETEHAFVINADFWDGVFLAWSWLHRDRYQLIIGSKRADPTINEQDWYRQLLSWGLNTALQTLFGSVCTDTHGMKLLHMPSMRPLLQATVLNRGQFDTEFTLRAFRAGLWIAEVPVPIVEHRPPRNLMINKIARNVHDITRLYRLMKKVPPSGPIRYHRWARIDLVEEVEAAMTALTPSSAPAA